MGFQVEKSIKEEYFYSGILDNPVIAKEGTKGNAHPCIERKDYVHVDPFECALVVSNGTILEYCALPGTYQYESYTSFSYISSSDDCKETFNEKKPLFSLEWNKKEKHLYYFNLRELNIYSYQMDSFPLHLTSEKYFIDMDCSVKMQIQFSYKIVNPIVFYLNVCQNFEEIFIGTEFEKTLKSNLNTAILTTFAKHPESGFEFVTNDPFDLFSFIQAKVNSVWKEQMGIELTALELDSKEIIEQELIEQAIQNGKKLISIQESELLNKEGTWRCSCGKINDSNFCRYCGKKRIEMHKNNKYPPVKI